MYVLLISVHALSTSISVLVREGLRGRRGGTEGERKDVRMRWARNAPTYTHTHSLKYQQHLETLPDWLRASCGRNMRALRLCHTTSQWRATTAEQHGCCVSVTTVLLLLSQHIDHVIWVVNMLTEERVVRELLGGAPPCRRLSREAQGWRISWGSTAKRTRKSPTEVPSARAVRVAPRSAICQLPASARSSWSPKRRVPRRHSLYHKSVNMTYRLVLSLLCERGGRNQRDGFWFGTSLSVRGCGEGRASWLLRASSSS